MMLLGLAVLPPLLLVTVAGPVPAGPRRGDRAAAPATAAIDRRALVTRHNAHISCAVLSDPSCSLSNFQTLGNGDFAFSVDVTGLQTFNHTIPVPNPGPGDQKTLDCPVNTMSNWGWCVMPIYIPNANALAPQISGSRRTIDQQRNNCNCSQLDCTESNAPDDINYDTGTRRPSPNHSRPRQMSVAGKTSESPRTGTSRCIPLAAVEPTRATPRAALHPRSSPRTTTSARTPTV